MKKALILASVASMIDQFNMENIQILKELGYEVHVAANFQYGSTTSQERVNFIKNKLNAGGVKVYDIPISRSIFSTANMKAYDDIKELMNENKYEIIHCHSPIGGVLARLAAKPLRKVGTKVIYTAHGFHFFKGASLINWALFYPIEKYFSKYTDVLITINKEDYERAKDKFKAGIVEYVPGIGVDTDKINNVNINRQLKRKQLGVLENDFLIISVGELNKNKNHEVVIRALANIDNKNIKYFICGQGPLRDHLINLIDQLGLMNNVELLGYRTDITELSKASDIFIFPSFREGLSVALMEAMATGLPVICSKIRGNTDLIEDAEGGYLINPNKSDEISAAINKIIDNKIEMEAMSDYNIKKMNGFSKQVVRGKMKSLYESVKNS